MTENVPAAEHLERVRRVRNVPCPKCGAGKGRPCHSPGNGNTTPHHAARWNAVYKRRVKK